MSRETAGNPFPKCFSAQTALRRACGARGGARGQVVSAPCRHPPAELVRGPQRPAACRVPGPLRRLPSPGRGASEYSEPAIDDFSFPVSPAAASVSSIKGKEVRKKTGLDPSLNN